MEIGYDQFIFIAKIGVVLGICFGVYLGLLTLNYMQLDQLNKETCKQAGIPQEQCFCKADIWGNVMCTMKQQNNTTISSTTISKTVIIDGNFK